MKRNKIILSAIVLLAVAGSAFAVKSSKMAPATVYLKQGSTYTLTNCNLTDPQACVPASVTQPNTYFTQISPGVYQAIAVGTPLKRAI